MQPSALVIEDNPRNVSVLGNLLAKQGFTHTAVLNSMDVEAAINEIDAIDIIFLDLEMPGMSGFDVLELLKADARFVHIPVVAYTVHVSEMNTAYEEGFHSFIAKPLDPDRFPEQLNRILNGERVWER